MFLMRKNHLDFKALAQSLAMDKDKLEDYIKVSLCLSIVITVGVTATVKDVRQLKCSCTFSMFK